MPSLADREHEHQAIAGLCDELTARGLPSAVLRWPDCDEHDPLTVDAVAGVAGVECVIEHCRLTADPTVVPATDEALWALEEPLRQIAEASGLSITLSVLPPAGGKRSDRKDYYKAALDLAQASAAQGAGSYGRADGVTMAVVGHPAADEGVRSAVVSFISDGRSTLSDRLHRAMQHAWTHKLSQQLPPAKAAGYPVLLLADAVPAPDQRAPSPFPATLYTVAQALQPLLDAHSGVIDQVWLRERAGSYHLVLAELRRGEVP